MPTTTEARPRGGPLDTLTRLLLPSPADLGDRGTLVTPLLVVLTTTLATTAATQLWGIDLMSAGGVESRDTVLVLMWLFAAASPLFALVKGGVLTALAWALMVVMGATTHLRATLSAFLYGEAILSFQAPTLLLTLLLQGGAHDGPVPVPTGLDAVVTGTHPVLLAMARGVTPFHVAWVVFLTVALASCGRTARNRGFVVAFGLWLLTIGIGALRAAVGAGAI